MTGLIELRAAGRGETAWRLAERLESLGAASVTVVPAESAGDLLEPLPGETPLWDRLEVRALFADRARAEAAAGELRRDGLDPAMQPCAERDWIAAGRQGFEPRRFGERLWIVPDWCEAPDPGAANVFLAPGLAFGTGTHPSTALCLEWLASAPLADASVIDYGAGSGILALAAARLGAAPVTAVDNDPQALAAVAENARRNGLEISAAAPEALDAQPVDILLANILARPLVSLAPTLLALVRPGGRIVLAGVTASQADAVAVAYAGGARLDARTQDGEWVRLDFTRLRQASARS